jgi:PTH1 family peptidyl-tRNA hydrolase
MRFAGRPLFLQKPLTYMNLSGEAVSLFCRRHKIIPQEILVIYDDLDLPLGRLRIRLTGSSGGQRGLQSIIDCLGTSKVPRMRIGIGPANEDAAKFVLSPFSDEEKAIVDKVITTGRQAVGTAVRRGLQQAMNQFNGTNYQQTELPEEPNP